MHAWQMQEAKARLSEVVKCAESEGPQNITLHGQSVAVLVSRAMIERLTARLVDDGMLAPAPPHDGAPPSFTAISHTHVLGPAIRALMLGPPPAKPHAPHSAALHPGGHVWGSREVREELRKAGGVTVRVSPTLVRGSLKKLVEAGLLFRAGVDAYFRE